MEKISVKDLLKATKGCLIQGKKNTVFSNISTDTRTLKKGDLFIALKGKNFDGHNFIPTAVRIGAKGVVVSQKITDKQLAVIMVNDTLKALQDIANYYRKRFDIPLIAITGSNGKTTTKEMLWNILSLESKTLKNKGNYNNEIGVPLTLFELNRQYKFAVLEFGTNSPGEIKRLTEIAQPSIGVITNIGLAHTEGLSDIEGVKKEKLSLLGGLRGRRVGVLNIDNEIILKSLPEIKKKSLRIITYGIKNRRDVYVVDIENLQEYGVKFKMRFRNLGKLQSLDIFLPLVGMHNVSNALAAAAVANLLKVKPANIKNGLQNFKGLPMRMEIKKFNGLTVINDSYNANPQSVKEVISIIEKWDAKRKILVLGDMLELGKYSRIAHKKLAEVARRGGIDILFTVGENSKITAKQFKNIGGVAFICKDNKEATKRVLERVKRGDLILIKGSRAMKMEEIAEGMIRRGR